MSGGKKKTKLINVSLNAGVPVFEDEFRLELYDEESSRPHEERYITIGHNKISDILYVVYTMRGYNKTRLISVRRAEPHERRLYQKMHGGDNEQEQSDRYL